MTHLMSPSNILNACAVKPAVSELRPDCRAQLLVGGVSWFPVAAAVLSAASSLWCVMERRRAGAG